MSASPSALGGLSWRVSQSCEGGACIIVARSGDEIVFGRSNDVNGTTYAYTRTEWDAFVAGVKRGDFDDLP
jgi:hypothetical protein